MRLLGSLALIALLLRFVSPSDLWQVIRTCDLGWVLLALLPWVVGLHLAFLSVFILLPAEARRAPWSRLYRQMLLAWSLGMLSPGKVGELSLGYLVHRDGAPLGPALAGCVADKILTLALSTVVALWAVATLFPEYLLVAAFVAAALAATVTIGLGWDRGRDGLRDFVLGRQAVRLQGFVRHLRELGAHRRRALATATGITIAKIAVLGTFLVVLARAFGLNLPWLATVMIHRLVMVIAHVPISLSGLGLREASGALLLGELGFDAAASASTFVVASALSYLLSALVLLFVRVGPPPAR